MVWSPKEDYSGKDESRKEPETNQGQVQQPAQQNQTQSQPQVKPQETQTVRKEPNQEPGMDAVLSEARHKEIIDANRTTVGDGFKFGFGIILSLLLFVILPLIVLAYTSLIGKVLNFLKLKSYVMYLLNLMK